jgi:hypothetical protein
MGRAGQAASGKRQVAAGAALTILITLGALPVTSAPARAVAACNAQPPQPVPEVTEAP